MNQSTVISSAGSRQDVGLLVLRLAVGGILLFHGISKLQHGVAWMAQPLAAFGLPAFVSYGAYLGEVVAPVLVILGIRTRLAALVISADLIMAIVLVLRSRVFAINDGGGWGVELEAFFILGGIALFFLGGGAYRVGPARTRWD